VTHLALGPDHPGPAPLDRTRLADALLALAGVRAVFLGGSRATGTDDAASDTDVYALHLGRLPGPVERAAALAPLADGGVVREETAWGVEDHLRVGGGLVEVVYLDADALGLDAFYDPGVDPTGYTTAFLHTLAHGVPLADPHGDLAAVQGRLTHYPEATRARMLEQLPRELAEYTATLTKAQARADWTGVTNRRAAFQAAWFDLLFAVNRRYHPGEKRLLTHLAGCSVTVADVRDRWARVSLAAADDPLLPGDLAALADDLVELTRP
jgi:hypothetical protein